MNKEYENNILQRDVLFGDMSIDRKGYVQIGFFIFVHRMKLMKKKQYSRNELKKFFVNIFI